MALDDDTKLAPSTEDELRERAVHSLKKKAAFRTHVVVYVLVNLLLIAIWLADGADGHFWPIWVIGGWGIGLALQGWDAYGPRSAISEDQISSEMNRLRGSS